MSIRDDESKAGSVKPGKKKKKKRAMETSATDEFHISPATNAALIQEEEEAKEGSPEFVKIDIRTAPKEVIGTKALDLQEKSKQAVSRIVNRLGQAEELAKEELIELQK